MAGDSDEPGGQLGRRELLRLSGLMGLGFFSMNVSPAALASSYLRPARNRPVIVIDPGHGGIDPGCIGRSGTYEKHIAFSIGYQVAALLEGTGRYTPVMTRSRDVFVPLPQRVIKARAARGDLFLSIHADSIPNPELRGASVFTLSEKASDKVAAEIAAHENDADLIAGFNYETQSPEVSDILLDLTRRQTANLSIGLARELVTHLSGMVRMLPHSHRSAGFAVLKAPDIPSALVETGCMSNQDEERLLRNATYRRNVAVGIVRSVDAYFRDVARA